MGRQSLILVFMILVATIGHASENGKRSTSTENETIKDRVIGGWERIVEFFTNDIPHFLKKDVVGELPEVRKVVEQDVSRVEKIVNNIEEEVENEIRSSKFTDSCECIQYNCGCCQHLEEPTVHLNSTLCANMSYLSEDIGISLTVTVNGYAIFNETVSVRNPPPVCLGVPYVKEYADACFRLYDIDATRSHLHACAQVEVRMKHILIAKYDLGCFDIGNYNLQTSVLNATESHFEEPSVLLV